jgi:iron(III) transport system substrate-binding protein
MDSFLHHMSLNRIHRCHNAYIYCAAIVWTCIFTGCESKQEASTATAPAGEVVIYCSVDRGFAEPLLDAFERETGVTVHARYDTEAGKTTGLVNKLLAERAAPRADVWWSSEIFGTVDLASAGILAPYRPTTANDIPDAFRDDDGLWTAFGLRGRVIAYDPKRTNEVDIPKRWADLTDEKYKGRVAIADPRFGTTRGHFAAMLASWGEWSFVEFLDGLRKNAVIRADGNSHAVLLLKQGRVAFAATDTDDVIVAQSRGDSIAAVYPDMTSPEGGTALTGTLWIPCSVALVKGARNEAAAKRLIDYIASERIERALYDSESKNVPVRASLRERVGAKSPHAAKVDYAAVSAELGRMEKLVAEHDPFGS